MSAISNESATRQSVGDGITAEQILQQAHRASEPVARYALALGDDALVLAQRLGWWISRAPELEEDMALANIALDLVGHARFLLSYAGTAWGRSEDDLAYFRDEQDFRSCRLVEMPNGDFGQTIARQLFYSHYAFELYAALQRSTDPTLAAIAAKAVKEVSYHRDHADQWVLRLGDGTEESHRRMQQGLDALWPYTGELFWDDPVLDELGEAAVRPSSLRQAWLDKVTAILEQATLQVPTAKQALSDHRTGAYSEHRGYILAEMQSLARQHPGASW